MSDEEDKAIEDELRTEMAEKARALGIRVHHTWDAAKIESVISEKALEDPTEPVEPALEGDDEPDVVELEEAEPEIPEGDGVLCRITKKGDGEVFTGRVEGERYAWKDMARLPIEIAQALEERGYVEIEE